MFLSVTNFFRYLIYPYNKKKITIYSEGIFYKNYYYELAKKLNKKNELVIVTSDKIEFESLKNIFPVFLIENLFVRFFFFTFVNCKYFLMTMNDIGNNYSKSKFCKNYVYFFHSLASTHVIYNEKAYDNYDIIFVNGKYQENEIRFRENLFKLKPKKIVNTGYFFLKYLRNTNNLNKIDKSVLFAPSWNKSQKNLFETLSIEIVQKLLDLKYHVILRPHPELIKRNFNKYNLIKKKFRNIDNFQIDNSANNNFLNKCELLITDNSTIGIEFALLNYKPPIYFNLENKIHNPNHKKIPFEAYENIFKKKFGINISSINELSNIDKLTNEFFINNNSYIEDLNKFELETLYNVDTSVDIACNFLQ